MVLNFFYNFKKYRYIMKNSNSLLHSTINNKSNDSNNINSNNNNNYVYDEKNVEIV